MPLILQLLQRRNDAVAWLRWVMLSSMLFSMLLTLAGQPQAFWSQPECAIRFDGLSIYNQTNHKFEFFLGHGWAPYIAACLVYFAAAFVLVSLMPKRPALIAIFSFIFGHFYGGANWLAVHWHSGVQGEVVYGLILAAMSTLALIPAHKHGFMLKRLSWIAAGALLVDFGNTLVGQPHSYWQNPAMAHEANALSRYFLMHGWWAFCIYDIAYCCVILLLASVLPRTGALISTFAFLLGGYAGASNWFFYEWRMGMETPVIYGIVLSAVLVWMAFPPIPETNQVKREPIAASCEVASSTC
jgi:hypothetical protein